MFPNMTIVLIFLLLIKSFNSDKNLNIFKYNKNITSLSDLDREISNVINRGCNKQIRNLLIYMENFTKSLKIHLKGIRDEDVMARAKAQAMLDDGGPSYFNMIPTFQDETIFRNRINFSDLEYQEYLYLAAKAKDQWDDIVLKLKNITC
uniref:Prolyl 4-hydroxylase alpha-subunit N-terminal domain-containing protein n=1 Tax=Homalodisca liturata TaxID=320908 RepID=A0A1B6ID22_9HEMI